MSKQKIRELALDKGFKLKEQPNGEMDLNPYVYHFAEALIKDRRGWVSPSLIELEKPCLLLTESGQIATGWLRQLEDDRYFCVGNEFASWDFEWNFDLGSVIGWLPLPLTKEA